jgi:hypothetical protein
MALNDNALVIRAVASNYLGITDGADAVLDAETERLINSASEIFAKRTKRILYKKTHTDYFDGSRTNRILLKQWPVTGGPADGNTKPEIFLDSKSLFPVGSEVDVSDYYVHNDIMIALISGKFYKGTRNIKVVYEAGLGNHAAGDIPSDLQEACLQFVQYLNQKHHDRRLGIASKGKSSENVTYELGIPMHIDELLQPYMRSEFDATNAPVDNG